MNLLPASTSRRGYDLLPLFLISAAAVGYETALTRYFAVAKWSEYGYWIISIVMAGLALSGVFVALARGVLLRHAAALLAWLPVALIATGALGYWAATANPFNPLQLQNPVTWPIQLAWIGLYYGELLPFFFLVGLYISLTFVLNDHRVGLVYGYDLTGAGAGALLVLVLMHWLHPFLLVPALLVVPALAALIPPLRTGPAPWAAIALVAAEALLLLDGHAAINDFKALYAPLHVPGARVLATIQAPRGTYTLMADFTERVDTDLSNNAGLLNLPGPPATFGLYRDANRIAALPKPGPTDARYASATLAALPYILRPAASVLLVGSSGGLRVREALGLGASRVTTVEPDPVIRAAEQHGLGPSPASAADPRVTVLAENATAAVRTGRMFDIIDISGDFLDEAEANAHAFTAQAVTAYLRALPPEGILQVPVSIREFPAYATRMLATIRAGLGGAGIPDAAAHVLVLRSAWNVRILVRPTPWPAPMIAQARQWADERSFDVSYYPGIDVTAARASIYNDLPSVSFERGEVISPAGTASDAVADEAEPALRGLPTASAATFNLQPITEDRPFFYDVLRLDRLWLILHRMEVLPQAEIGPLVNVAVLAQSLLLASAVVAVPVFARRRRRATRSFGIAQTAVYFATLGVGFLFIEITAIEKAAFLLNDRATAFALVLSVMLICSGAGSLLSGHLPGQPRRWLWLAAGAVALWCAAAALGADQAIQALSGWPAAGRVALVIGAVAPVSLALGVPFPLGLQQLQAGSTHADGFMLPWAWALNGAFSVVATPLANLAALTLGFDRVLLLTILLYGLSAITFPQYQRAPRVRI